MCVESLRNTTKILGLQIENRNWDHPNKNQNCYYSVRLHGVWPATCPARIDGAKLLRLRPDCVNTNKSHRPTSRWLFSFSYKSSNSDVFKSAESSKKRHNKFTIRSVLPFVNVLKGYLSPPRWTRFQYIAFNQLHKQCLKCYLVCLREEPHINQHQGDLTFYSTEVPSLPFTFGVSE
jgi:hypothetical protein